jgi:hypothetical protein
VFKRAWIVFTKGAEYTHKRTEHESILRRLKGQGKPWVELLEEPLDTHKRCPRTTHKELLTKDPETTRRP